MRPLVITGAEDPQLERLAVLCRQAGSWTVSVTHGAAELARLRTSALGYIIATDAGTDDETAAELARRSTTVPVLVIGKDPCCAAAPTCWLPEVPSAALLAGLLRELLPTADQAAAAPRSRHSSAPPPSYRSWRRKGDMIIGSSTATRQLLGSLDRVARSSAPVMITGESGTGKELVARALHNTSPRAGEPMISINCAAIPETLFEAELFGYQRGAFTGAVAAHPGAFEAAHKGTLFLDEVGDMPRALQPKLLRALERGEITRLGSNEARKVSVRIVTATNRNLESEVRRGAFREDLYYRLRVYPVHVPPLRERPEDIPPIAAHHMTLIAFREHQAVPRLTQAALERLLSYRWPGNVRELVNTLEQAFLLADNHEIDAGHIALPSVPGDALIQIYRDAKVEFEQHYYSMVMRTAGGNVSLAAKLAQKTRKEVYDALKKLELDATTYRDGYDKSFEA